MKTKILKIIYLGCLVSLLFLNISSAHGKSDDSIPFLRRDLLQAHQLSEKIIKIYPPQKYYYVFIGRSLTMIRAIMDVQGIPNTGLPFSGKSIDLNFESEFGQRLRPILLQHLADYLPEDAEIGHKELVLLDFTVSGDGIKTAQKTLRWYYDDQRPLHLLSITFWGPLFDIFVRPFFREQDRSISIDPDSMFGKRIIHSNFDSYAGYGSFDVETAKFRDRNRSLPARYEALKSWILNMQPTVLPNSETLRCSHYLR